MADYLTQQGGPLRTPQNQPIPGRTDQVQNEAGGYAWQISDIARVKRFLILGSEGGTYYQREGELTQQNIAAGMRAIEADGAAVVELLLDVSRNGRAAKRQPTIFLLAAATAAKNDATRALAVDAIASICRTGNDLLTFCRYVELFRGWGRGLRAGVGAWYLGKDADALAYQLVKYRQREGWTHRDVLRLAHPKTTDRELESVWRFALGTPRDTPEEPVAMIEGFHLMQAAKTAGQAAQIVRDYRLPREAVLSEHLADPLVWAALLEVGMPMGALVRNLGNLGKHGLLVQLTDTQRAVCAQITNETMIRKSRIHPVQILSAMLTYGSGRGQRGSGSWQVNPHVMEALDAAFYLAFENVEPTGKPHFLALDVSPSMWGHEVSGIPGLTAAQGTGAMALITASIEPEFGIFAFAGTLAALDISKGMRMDAVMQKLHALGESGKWSHTDCAQPMQAATSYGLEVEQFVIYTDNETRSGAMHPSQALNEYRAKGPGNAVDAKLAVVAMASGGTSIADPNDPGMLDLNGFDTATPALIAAMARGELA